MNPDKIKQTFLKLKLTQTFLKNYKFEIKQIEIKHLAQNLFKK